MKKIFLQNAVFTILFIILLFVSLTRLVLGWTPPNSNPPNSTNQAMYMDASGNVGIGTTTPTGIFTIASSTTGTSLFTVLSNGNVGIGTTNPTDKLYVAGDSYDLFEIRGTGTKEADITYRTNEIGAYWEVGTGMNGSPFGNDAFSFYNASSSSHQMTLDDDGDFYIAGNVGIGTTTPNNLLSVYQLIDFNNTDFNTKLGYQAGKNIVSGATHNTFLGYQAGLSSATLSTNVADYNSAIGSQALYSNTTGSGNFAIGFQSLFSNTTGYENYALGFQSLYSNLSGHNNAALGFQTLYYNTQNYNSAFGNYALSSNTTGGSNTALGYDAFRFNTSGSNNLAVGFWAGRYLSSGAANETSGNSIFLGYNTRASAAGGANEIVIGYSAIGAGSNSVVLGDDNITKTLLKGNVGIGTTGPNAKLDVNGGFFRVLSVNSPTQPTSGTGVNIVYRGDAGYSQGIGGYLFSYDHAGSVYKPMTFDVANLNVAIGGATKMVVDTSGNVGIGTTNPLTKLVVGSFAYVGGDTPSVGSTFTTNINSAGATTNVDNGYQLSLTETSALGANKGGALAFQAVYDGSNNIATVGGIKGLRENATTGNFAGYLSFLTRNAAGTTAEKMRIDSAGNVGIGTTTPAYPLSVAGTIYSSTGGFRFPDGTTQATAFQGGSQTVVAANVSSGQFGANTGGGNYYFPSNVGIGTTGSNSMLSVGFAGYSATRFALKQPAADSYGLIIEASGSDRWVRIGHDGTQGIIESTYNSTGGYSDLIVRAAGGKNLLLQAGETGNVGIGTTVPAANFHIYENNSDTLAAARIENAGTGDASLHFLITAATNWTIGADNSDGDSFKLSENTELGTNDYLTVLKSTGNVGIGTTGPTYRLQLSTDSAGKPNGGSWANSSDARLKTNINPITGALDKITNLQGVNFEWKNPDEHASKTNEVRAGFIAQEVEKVFPQFISGIDASGKDKELAPDGKIKSLTLPFDFDAYLVEAIKELKTKNEAQQKQIEELKSEIKELKSGSAN